MQSDIAKGIVADFREFPIPKLLSGHRPDGKMHLPIKNGGSRERIAATKNRTN